MVQTRSQLENLSKEKLIEELITVDDYHQNFLTYQIDSMIFRDLKLFNLT